MVWMPEQGNRCKAFSDLIRGNGKGTPPAPQRIRKRIRICKRIHVRICIRIRIYIWQCPVNVGTILLSRYVAEQNHHYRCVSGPMKPVLHTLDSKFVFWDFSVLYFQWVCVRIGLSKKKKLGDRHT